MEFVCEMEFVAGIEFVILACAKSKARISVLVLFPRKQKTAQALGAGRPA
jgi:hypothetical protein